MKDIHSDKGCFIETIHPMTGDILWKMKGNVCAPDEVMTLVQSYINKFYHSDYSLSIFDIRTNRTIEIDCEVRNIPTLVTLVFNIEKAAPLSFIGGNCISDSYVVGMPLNMGMLEKGCYKDEGGKLVKKA